MQLTQTLLQIVSSKCQPKTFSGATFSKLRFLFFRQTVTFVLLSNCDFCQIVTFVLSSNCDQMDAAAGQTEAQIGLEYDIIRRQVRLN